MTKDRDLDNYISSMKSSLLSLDKEFLEGALPAQGWPKFRAKQLWAWLHGRRSTSFDAMSDLPENLRDDLKNHFVLRSLEEKKHEISSDGFTEKWLFETPLDEDQAPAFAVNPEHTLFEKRSLGGRRSGQIETVLIREKRLRRQTVCVSCSVGCPIGCVFCATGNMGYERNLSRGAIVEQVYRVDETARETPGAEGVDGGQHPRGITNIVFMGMGEPLLNYEEVVGAAKILTDQNGFGIGGRHITISTVGVPAGIRRLAREKNNFRLAVSLHAPDQELRRQLVPTAGKWPLDDLLDALKEFTAGTSRDITIEYTLIKDINDQPDHAHRLAELLLGLPCKINAIPLNPNEHYPEKPPERHVVTRFQDILMKAGIICTVRAEKGRDIAAACGQLSVHRNKDLNLLS